VNAEDSNGDTPLDNLANTGREEIAKLLIEKGAIVTLHNAAAFGDIARVQALLSKGGGVNGRDRDGWTPLHWAAFWGRNRVANALIAKGADVNMTGRNNGWTPLHCAGRKGYMRMVVILVAAGANVHMRDKAGETPAEQAAWFGHKAVAEYLVAHGAALTPHIASALGKAEKLREFFLGGTVVIRWIHGGSLSSTGQEVGKWLKFCHERPPPELSIPRKKPIHTAMEFVKKCA